ncbi:endothelin-converting enzyme-like protein, partial [Dinothrombium tinctorium]
RQFVFISTVFPAALLQTPLYTFGLPSSLNFGAIGSIIGHELLHAFDRVGKQYDSYGNYKDWWTNATSEIYQNKSDCFAQHYSRFIDPKSLLRIDGQLTKEENIGDAVGIQLAFEAFKSFMDTQEQPLLLEGLEYTAEQLFFISFAQVSVCKLEPVCEHFFIKMWCINETRESKRNTIMYGPHSPEYFRVIGSVANFNAFANAFNCKNGSAMYSESKCSLW